jgi:hypothetical protein
MWRSPSSSLSLSPRRRHNDDCDRAFRDLLARHSRKADAVALERPHGWHAPRAVSDPPQQPALLIPATGFYEWREEDGKQPSAAHDEVMIVASRAHNRNRAYLGDKLKFQASSVTVTVSPFISGVKEPTVTLVFVSRFRILRRTQFVLTLK